MPLFNMLTFHAGCSGVGGVNDVSAWWLSIKLTTLLEETNNSLSSMSLLFRVCSSNVFRVGVMTLIMSGLLGPASGLVDVDLLE